MPSNDKLRSLFRAFAERNDALFQQVAESMISEELAANHHSFAADLTRALQRRRPEARESAAPHSLTVLPRDRRNGEDLIRLEDSSVPRSRLVLSVETNARIERVLDEHRQRNRLAKYGYTPKSQLLFWGPPGCGKTLTAHYVAHALGLPIGTLRLSSVISSFLGDTASHLQRVFDLASGAPMVLLMDEVDAVAKDRDDPNDVGELKRVVNGLLQAMDSFRPNQSIVIAASNHQYLLDPAIWRRFDDVVHFPLPDEAGRDKHLHLLLSGVTYGGSTRALAKQFSSLSYADTERVVVEAVKSMILEGREQLRRSDVMRQLSDFRSAVSVAEPRSGTAARAPRRVSR